MNKLIKPFISAAEQRYLLAAFGLLLLYVLPYIWLGQGAYLIIHDNLDSDFLYLHLLNITGTAFDFDPQTIIPNVMSGGPSQGIPRSAFRTGLNLEVLSFWLLPPYVAQVVNFAAVHVIGFVGMYALLRRYVLPESRWALTRVAVALLYALVPCYTVHGASVTGQPLILFAFLNLLNNRVHWSNWLIIVLFPFYSFFVWAGLFIAVALGLTGLVFMVQTRRVNWTYIGGLVLLSLLYVGSEWQLIYGFINQAYVSHRIDFDYSQLRSMRLMDSLRRSADLFIWPMFNTGAFLTLGILAVAGAGAWKAYQRNDWRTVRWLAGLPVLASVICLIHGMYHYLVVALGNSSIGLNFRAFQFDRFYFLLPTLWFILFAMGLWELGGKESMSRKEGKVSLAYDPMPLLFIGLLLAVAYINKSWQVLGFVPFAVVLRGFGKGVIEQRTRQSGVTINLVLMLLAAQLAVMVYANKEWRINVGKMTGFVTEAEYPSYRAFFAEKQFAQIKNYIGRPQTDYRVVCLGMHPSVAQYNGFYTLDSYQNNYPLAYKQAFRKIIATELAKGTPKMRAYYDAYGCRAYLYTAELGMNYLFGKTENRVLNNLQINTSALAALGGKYVISAVPVRNPHRNRLRLERIFSHSESYWKAWLYKVQ